MPASLVGLRPFIADAKNALRTLAIHTKPKGGMPDAIIIGAQKAGTTALFEALARHRHVRPSRIKEVHFADRHWAQGENWYARCFPKGAGIRLEATPNYLFYPHAAPRTARVAPKARLIAILRDPVMRALSQHRYETQRGKETRSFTDAIAAEQAKGETEWRRAMIDPSHWPATLQSQSYLRRGLYADHLARWRAEFDPEQIIVIEDHALYSKPDETLAQIATHIGLPDSDNLTLEKVNVGKRPTDALPDPVLYQYFATDCEALQRDWGLRPSWAAMCEAAT
jgi:hypothetical protein